MITRRNFFLGTGLIAAPAIIRIPGILMPVRAYAKSYKAAYLIDKDNIGIVEITVDDIREKITRSPLLGVMKNSIIPKKDIESWQKGALLRYHKGEPYIGCSLIYNKGEDGAAMHYLNDVFEQQFWTRAEQITWDLQYGEKA